MAETSATTRPQIRISIQVPPGLMSQIERLAKDRHQSVAAITRELIQRGLKDLRDEQRLLKAARAS